MDTIMMLDDDDAPQAAAAAKKAPLWPPPGNKDLASWPKVPSWGAHKDAAAEARVKEKYQAYQQASEAELEKKRDTFLGELAGAGNRLDQPKNAGPFTFREDCWIQLEAIRRLWVERTTNSANWAAAVRPFPPPSFLSRCAQSLTPWHLPFVAGEQSAAVEGRRRGRRSGGRDEGAADSGNGWAVCLLRL
jgi:hypothetical protein